MKGREAGKVSVVITNYNRAAYLKECLDSLLQQTYTNMEIILVDDASTDQSVDVVQKWIAENQDLDDPRIQVVLVQLPRNAGFAGAMTTGFFLAQGEFIAVQDADDFSHPARLEQQVMFLRSHLDVDLVGTNYVSFEDGPVRQYKPANWLQYGGEIRKVYRNGGHCVCHGTILFRGLVFDRIGGLSRRITGAEDYEFIVKFLHMESKIENLPDILYYYRMHSDQRSTAFFRKKE